MLIDCLFQMTQTMIIGKSRWLLFSKICKAIIKGRKHTVIIFQDGTPTLKPEVDWTNVEDDETLGNSKVLTTISNGNDKIMFRLTNTCIEAKKE